MENKETITRQVLTHHLTAFGDNNIEEILKDYVEESEIFTPVGTLRGLAAIRSFSSNPLLPSQRVLYLKCSNWPLVGM